MGDAGAAGLGEELGAEADQAARRDDELHAHPAGAVVGHLLHAALAGGQQLGDRAEVLLGGVDREALHRLVDLAVDLLGDHLRLADGQLVALAAHLLHEDRQRQLAAALDLPRVGAVGREDLERDVADELGVQAVLDQAGGDLRALDLAHERGGVGADGHRDGRVVDVDQRQGDRVLRVGQGLADGDVGDAGDGDDVTGVGDLAGLALQALGDEELGDADVLDLAAALHPGHGLALLQLALVDAQQRQATQERAGVEVGDVCLQGRALDVLRGGDGLDDRAEQRLEVLGVTGQGAVLGLLEARDAGLAGGVHDREVQGVLGVRLVEQVHEQLVGLVDDLGDPGVGPVGLVDDQDHRHVGVQRLAQHEAGLR